MWILKGNFIWNYEPKIDLSAWKPQKTSLKFSNFSVEICYPSHIKHRRNFHELKTPIFLYEQILNFPTLSTKSGLQKIKNVIFFLTQKAFRMKSTLHLWRHGIAFDFYLQEVSKMKTKLCNILTCLTTRGGSCDHVDYLKCDIIQISVMPGLPLTCLLILEVSGLEKLIKTYIISLNIHVIHKDNL